MGRKFAAFWLASLACASTAGIGAFTMRTWKGFRRDAEERPAPA